MIAVIELHHMGASLKTSAPDHLSFQRASTGEICAPPGKFPIFGVYGGRTPTHEYQANGIFLI
jgi:hypothetical protein